MARSRKAMLTALSLTLIALAAVLVIGLINDGRAAPAEATTAASSTVDPTSAATTTIPSNAATTTSSGPVTTQPSVSGTTTVPTKTTLLGTIEVSDGDILERDIIPQLSAVFSLSEDAVKTALAAPVASDLIRSQLTDFRRLEGVLPPGLYDISQGTTLPDWLQRMVKSAEHRYETLLARIDQPNGLKPEERLILASMIEAECLADRHHAEAAAVFLNRIEKNGKLQSCVTAEYALGYQRPFLTSEDLKVNSPYNTYVVGGLPAGPICSVDDESLLAAIGRSTDRALYFFFYDYILDKMFFFSDYDAFKREAAVSRERFIDRSPIGLRDKINKQVLYGVPGG